MGEVTRPPAGRLISQLAYEDPGAAVEFLVRAFGLRERREARVADGQGRVLHAELESECGEGLMIGHSGGHGLTSPAKLGGPSGLTVLYVGDVEAHQQRALAAGAALQAELEDKFWGDRVYEARDPEGHVWMFCQRVRDIAPEDWILPGSA